MHPPTKDQADIGQDNVLLDASDQAVVYMQNGKEDEPNKDMARQEFKQESDINYMLSRFGITPPRGAPTYGEWDDTIDLQKAIDMTKKAQVAYRRLPKELRDKFDNMGDFLDAVENGSLVTKDIPPDPAPVDRKSE